MTKTYDPADDSVLAYIAGVMKAKRPDLAEAGVTVDALMVGGGLDNHGYPAHAVITINSAKERARGKADCSIEIDADRETGYDAWPDAQREAIIHHELLHPLLVKDKAGKIKRDDKGRPKLQMRKHDIVVGGFSEIIEAHKEAAPEAQALANGMKFIQGLFRF